MGKLCSECHMLIKAKGLCSKHYQRLRATYDNRKCICGNPIKIVPVIFNELRLAIVAEHIIEDYIRLRQLEEEQSG